MQGRSYRWQGTRMQVVKLALPAFVASLVHLVDLVHLVSFVQPNKQDKSNKPNNDLRMLADFFSILLEVRGILACGCMPLKAKWGTHIA